MKEKETTNLGKLVEEEIKRIISDVQGKNGKTAKHIAEINIAESLRRIPLLQAYIKTLEAENLKMIDELSKVNSSPYNPSVKITSEKNNHF